MPADEWLGWQAFHELEPWGCYVEDQRAATALDLTFATHAKASAKPPVWFDRDPQASRGADPSPEELDEKIKDFFAGKTVRVEAPAEPDQPPAK